MIIIIILIFINRFFLFRKTNSSSLEEKPLKLKHLIYIFERLCQKLSDEQNRVSKLLGIYCQNTKNALKLRNPVGFDFKTSTIIEKKNECLNLFKTFLTIKKELDKFNEMLEEPRKGVIRDEIVWKLRIRAVKSYLEESSQKICMNNIEARLRIRAIKFILDKPSN
jgi:hypothetical protein